RWSPAAPTAPAWAWRSRARSRASTAANSATYAVRARPCSPCCCRSATRDPDASHHHMRETAAWIDADHRSVRVVLGAALREAGFRPREFADAEAALAALETDEPDVLFTDVRMPGASGLKLLERIGLREPRIPVVVMSAFTDVASTA